MCVQRGTVRYDHRVLWNNYCSPTNGKRLRSRAGGFRYSDRRVEANCLELVKFIRCLLQFYRRILTVTAKQRLS